MRKVDDMSSHNRSQSSARRSDYVWQYEYYDEEPVSFEGLKAHRYSIVISFWVGLAVFVIFMFFVLTLLTKTGAPQQESPDAENQPGPGNGLVNIISQKTNDDDDSDDDKAVSHPFLAESRPYFNFYIRDDKAGKCWQKPETEQNGLRRLGGTTTGVNEEDDKDLRDSLPVNGLGKTEMDCDLLSHFNIPNFVTFEHNSSLGEDDLLCEPPITPDQNV